MIIVRNIVFMAHLLVFKVMVLILNIMEMNIQSNEKVVQIIHFSIWKHLEFLIMVGKNILD